jgi:hypothetical protein
VARNIAKLAGALGNALKDPWAQVYFQECPE